jgi:benzoate membrane transport protein
LNILPKTYIVALAGLAIISSLQDALEKSFTGAMRFGALVGFVVAATPFAIFGITSAFWAIIAGVLASALAERQQLLDFWKEGEASRARINV